MHDGANARAWVVLQVKLGSTADGATLPGPNEERNLPGTQFLTKVEGLPVVLRKEDVSPAVSAGAEVFESLHDVDLHAAHNEIQFYTWGDTACCLPKGATSATLIDQWVPAPEALTGTPAAKVATSSEDPPGTVRVLRNLKVRDVLIFEEVIGPKTGNSADADPKHRQAVRLTKVTPAIDPLYHQKEWPDYGQPVVKIEWAHEDALPFPLCLSTETVADVSVARGNVVLVDHGCTIADERLARIPKRGDYPALQFGPLTQQGYMYDRHNQLRLFDPDAPASAAFRWQIQTVKPAIRLKQDTDVTVWSPQRELLNSGRFTPEFVVETENDGRAYLRFGDGVLGRKPVDDLKATYRVGNGRTGNVGAEAIAHVVDLAGIGGVRNPLPAQGGTEPETLEQVRLYAPQAFRTQERAVTEADYAEAAGRPPRCAKASRHPPLDRQLVYLVYHHRSQGGAAGGCCFPRRNASISGALPPGRLRPRDSVPDLRPARYRLYRLRQARLFPQ